MGQYYKIVNVDKKQFIGNIAYSGSKLMEFAYENNDKVNAMTHLMMNEWNGDRVFVVGDYADLYNMDENSDLPYMDTLSSLGKELGYEGLIADENSQVITEGYEYNLYAYATENFENIEDYVLEKYGEEYEDPVTKERYRKISKPEYQYIINENKDLYIDVDSLPMARKGSKGAISPLALLLAMGNGQGGGDYYSGYPSYDLVGSWCEDADSISFENANEGEYIKKYYKEFKPNFTEYPEQLEIQLPKKDEENMETNKIKIYSNSERNAYFNDLLFFYEKQNGNTFPNIQIFEDTKKYTFKYWGKYPNDCVLYSDDFIQAGNISELQNGILNYDIEKDKTLIVEIDSFSYTPTKPKFPFSNITGLFDQFKKELASLQNCMKEFDRHECIKKISSREATRIFDSEKNGKYDYIGKYLVVESDGCMAIDNSTGDAWTHDFDKESHAIVFLTNPNFEYSDYIVNKEKYIEYLEYVEKNDLHDVPFQQFESWHNDYLDDYKEMNEMVNRHLDEEER